MGMDGVEMAMLTEERFGIAIEDAEASKVTTTRQLIELILSKTAGSGPAVCKTHRGFAVVRRSLLHAGAKRNDVRPDSHLRNLLPADYQPFFWTALRASVGAEKLPDLEWPPASAVTLATIAVGFLAVTISASQLGVPI